MKSFVCFLTQKRAFTEEVIARHVAHLRNLSKNGQLVLCGPFADDQGGMVIVLAESEAAACELAQADPFVAEKFEDFELREIRLANEGNNYLL